MERLIKYSKYIISILVLSCFVLLFFNCGVYRNGSIVLHESTGYEMIFGKQTNGVSILKFNVIGFVLLLTMLASCVVLFLEKYIGKKTRLISLVCLLTSSILFFLLPSTVSHAVIKNAHLFSSLPCVIIGANILFVTALFSIFIIVVKEE